MIDCAQICVDLTPNSSHGMDSTGFIGGAEMELLVWYGALAAILQIQHKKNNNINKWGQNSNILQIQQHKKIRTVQLLNGNFFITKEHDMMYQFPMTTDIDDCFKISITNRRVN